MADKIAAAAKGYESSAKWKYAVEKGEMAANTNKNNQFVYDMIAEAGISPPTVSKYVVMSRMPTCSEWADPDVSLPGWDVVQGQSKPGDVIAECPTSGDANGHCGIVVGPNQTASAMANEGGTIVVNDWGFRQDNRPTLRRYTGKK